MEETVKVSTFFNYDAYAGLSCSATTRLNPVPYGKGGTVGRYEEVEFAYLEERRILIGLLKK